MSEQKSSWILELVDRISSPMKNVMTNTNQASKSVEKLGTDLKGISNMPGKILGTLGIGFGMFQFVQMMDKGIEKAHDLHAAEAQIEAGLKSTGYAAGMTMESISDVAKQISSNSKISRTEMLAMQSILVTFPDITSRTFGTASQAIADMSVRMKQDLSSTAVQVGKALQDPERGITALRRVGVNFNKAKLRLIRILYQRHWDKQRVIDLFSVLYNSHVYGALKFFVIYQRLLHLGAFILSHRVDKACLHAKMSYLQL